MCIHQEGTCHVYINVAIPLLLPTSLLATILLLSTALVVCKRSPEYRTCSASPAGSTLASPVSDLDTNTVTNPPPPCPVCLSLCSKPWLLVAAGDRRAGSLVLLLLGQSCSAWEQPRACSSPAPCSSLTLCLCPALLMPLHH